MYDSWFYMCLSPCPEDKDCAFHRHTLTTDRTVLGTQQARDWHCYIELLFLSTVFLPR